MSPSDKVRRLITVPRSGSDKTDVYSLSGTMPVELIQLCTAANKLGDRKHHKNLSRSRIEFYDHRSRLNCL